MPNVVQQILAAHRIGPDASPGQDVALRVDQGLLQDATGTMACMELEELGVERVKIPFAIVYVDHNILAIDHKNPDDHVFLRTFAARYGLHYSRPGNGICHYLHLERFARPGQVLIGADSHTTTAGAVAMLAIGAGGLDVGVSLAGVPFVLEMPLIVGVRLEGKLGPWVQAKDVILELLRRHGVRGGRGRIYEFHGPGVATLSVPQRGTICNMIAELGATTGLFPSDAQTREWLEAQGRGGDWTALEADRDARWDEEETIALDALEPLIAKPSSPGNVVPVREVAGTRVAQVCVGSSVNSGYADLAIVAAVLRGRIVHPDVFMTVTPGSREILDVLAATGAYRDLVAAGARMLEPACGPCVGMGQAPPTGAVSVRTFNRNFPGRSGTENDQVYLCSPTTAAATALRGVITDPRELGAEPALPEAPAANPRVDDQSILAPAPADRAASIQIIRGPNIKPPPPQRPMPDRIDGEVLIALGDDVSTGDLTPDGVVVMALRSNVEAIADFTLRRFDRGFAARAREKGGGFIVAGQNYGQGSSREHAALAPKALGVRGVVAKSFARIHRRNLIAQGIPPLTFVSENDRDRVRQGDRLDLSGLRDALGAGAPELDARLNGEPLRLRCAFSVRESEVLRAGGLLAWLKQGGAPLSVGVAVSALADQGSPITNSSPQDETVR